MSEERVQMLSTTISRKVSWISKVVNKYFGVGEMYTHSAAEKAEHLHR